MQIVTQNLALDTFFIYSYTEIRRLKNPFENTQWLSAFESFERQGKSSDAYAIREQRGVAQR